MSHASHAPLGWGGGRWSRWEVRGGLMQFIGAGRRLLLRPGGPGSLPTSFRPAWRGPAPCSRMSTLSEEDPAGAAVADPAVSSRLAPKVSQHKKHKIPQKRASALLSQLRQEAKDSLTLQLPDFKAGDALEIQMLAHKTAPKPLPVRGVVIRRVNRGSDSSVLLRDVIADTEVERLVPLYSPLIKEVKVLQQRFIQRAKDKDKRVRQSRIYYIRDRDQKFCRVTG